MKRQSGFTLIELIIVIVILGILAVTAAPQFFNFGSDARESTVRGMEGSVKAAADLVYARSAIQGVEGSENTTVSISGSGTGTIAVAYGYPTAAGLVNALNVSQGGDDSDWTFSTPTDGTIAITPRGRTATSVGATGTPDPDERCQVEYTEADAPGTRPTIVSFVEGC